MSVRMSDYLYTHPYVCIVRTFRVASLVITVVNRREHLAVDRCFQRPRHRTFTVLRGEVVPINCVWTVECVAD